VLIASYGMVVFCVNLAMSGHGPDIGEEPILFIVLFIVAMIISLPIIFNMAIDLSMRGLVGLLIGTIFGVGVMLIPFGLILAEYIDSVYRWGGWSTSGWGELIQIGIFFAATIAATSGMWLLVRLIEQAYVWRAIRAGVASDSYRPVGDPKRFEE